LDLTQKKNKEKRKIISRALIIVKKHKLHGLVGRSFGNDGILAMLVTILLVHEVGNDEDEDSSSNCAHYQIGLGMELGIDET
jgi:hypothetical protein